MLDAIALQVSVLEYLYLKVACQSSDNLVILAINVLTNRLHIA